MASAAYGEVDNEESNRIPVVRCRPTPGRSVVFRIGDNGIVWLTADPSSGLTALHGVTDPDLFCSSLGTEGRQITPLQFLFQRNGGSHLLVQEAVHHALVYRTVSFDICGELAGLEPIAEGDVRFGYHDNDAGGTSPGGNAFGGVAVGTVADREHGSEARLTVRNLVQILPSGEFRETVATVELDR